MRVLEFPLLLESFLWQTLSKNPAYATPTLITRYRLMRTRGTTGLGAWKVWIGGIATVVSSQLLPSDTDVTSERACAQNSLWQLLTLGDFSGFCSHNGVAAENTTARGDDDQFTVRFGYITLSLSWILFVFLKLCPCIYIHTHFYIYTNMQCRVWVIFRLSSYVMLAVCVTERLTLW